MKLELAIFVLLLAALNSTLLVGIVPENLVLLPSLVTEGQYWRLVTFGFVHNSIYHLVLDGAAFLYLYRNLKGTRAIRLSQFAICLLASGIVPALMSPEISQLGLCGMSGVAHGLMAIWALDAIRAENAQLQKAGWLLLIGLIAKVGIEMSSGELLLKAWHLGNVGVPIPSCHLGGIIGGIVSGFVFGGIKLEIRGGSSLRCVQLLSIARNCLSDLL